MFGRLKIKRQQRRIARQDGEYLEGRARRFLDGYLSASEPEKDRYLDVIADVAATCQPENVVSFSENLQVAEITAATASAVVLRRIPIEQDCPGDPTYEFLTDACATVAVAYRRAAGIYVGNKQMQRLGTAAVHLLTMATSHKMAKSKSEGETAEEDQTPEASASESTTEQSGKNG